MSRRGEFNYRDLLIAELRNPEQFLTWLNTQFKELKLALPGPRGVQKTGAAAITIDLGDVDLVQLTLTANTAITLKGVNSVRAGARSHLEVIQDATGGRVPSWVGATSTGGAIPAPATGANKRTLYSALYNGATWVLTVLASNY
jgi:hypothetical protein